MVRSGMASSVTDDEDETPPPRSIQVARPKSCMSMPAKYLIELALPRPRLFTPGKRECQLVQKLPVTSSFAAIKLPPGRPLPPPPVLPNYIVSKK
jgi:hypothetical protein